MCLCRPILLCSRGFSRLLLCGINMLNDDWRDMLDPRLRLAGLISPKGGNEYESV